MTAILRFPRSSATFLPDKQQLLDTLKTSPNPLSDVFLAAHFDTSCQVVRSLLHELEAEGAVSQNSQIRQKALIALEGYKIHVLNE